VRLLRLIRCVCRLKRKLTLGCYPFQDRDPFVVEETPHVFFAGNQPEYSSRLIQGTLNRWCLLMTGENGQLVQVLCIPKFSETGEVILVNLTTLESEVVRFSSGTLKMADDESEGNGDNVMDDIEEL